MSRTRKIQVKWRYILIGILVFLLMMIPFPIHDVTGTTTKYVAVLWSFRRDKVVLEQDVGGVDDHVKYRIVYRAGFLCSRMQSKITKYVMHSGD